MTRPTQPRAPLGSRAVQADEILPLAELRHRWGWGEEKIRKARRAGLRTIKFGREVFVRGSDLLAFFDVLAERAAERETVNLLESANGTGNTTPAGGQFSGASNARPLDTICDDTEGSRR